MIAMACVETVLLAVLFVFYKERSDIETDES